MADVPVAVQQLGPQSLKSRQAPIPLKAMACPFS